VERQKGGWINTLCDDKRAHTEQESMAGYHKINFGTYACRIDRL
jgi:hypothetical protein